MWPESPVPGTHGANASSLAGLYTVADPEGVQWVPWNPSFEGLPSKILCANVLVEISSLDGFLKAAIPLLLYRCPREMGTPQFGDPGPHIPSDMGTPGPHITRDMGLWGPQNSGDMGIPQ